MIGWTDGELMAAAEVPFGTPRLTVGIGNL